jgi:YVTN family beta-propeller protein
VSASAASTATATFLFTDIEGSTALLKRLGDAYGHVLAEHQRLLREAFARHGGREVDTQGDAFFVAFPSARAAVAAAVDAQRVLAHHEWPDGVDVRVRMGVHTGGAAVSEDRYVGLAVHRAARIAAAGHGGQVLVSETTERLLEDEPLPDVRLRDLGWRRLKDLDRPVRIFQVTAPGLHRDFPALRTVDREGRRRRRATMLAVAGVAAAALVVSGAIFVSARSGGLDGVDVNAVGVIDASGSKLVDQVPVGLRPGPIAFAGRSLWVGNEDDRTLTEIDVATRRRGATVPLQGATPTGIAVGAGSVWVAHGRLGTVSQVNPQFKNIEHTFVVGVHNGGGIAFGAGAVWTVWGDSSVVRIPPGGGKTVRASVAGERPVGVAAGGEPAYVWVANGRSTVYRYNPETFMEGRLDQANVGPRPSAIALGFGSVWVTDQENDKLYRLDDRGLSTETIDVGRGPTAVAIGEGAVWVANGGDGTVTKVDPGTDDVVATIKTGNYPAGIAAGGGAVWVTVQAP